MCIGYVGPEAFDGGPLGLVQEGDVIWIDASTGTLERHVSANELARRRSSWSAKTHAGLAPTLSKYVHRVGPAPLGAVAH